MRDQPTSGAADQQAVPVHGLRQGTSRIVHSARMRHSLFVAPASSKTRPAAAAFPLHPRQHERQRQFLDALNRLSTIDAGVTNSVFPLVDRPM